MNIIPLDVTIGELIEGFEDRLNELRSQGVLF